MIVEQVHGLVHLRQFDTPAVGQVNHGQPAFPETELGLRMVDPNVNTTFYDF